MTTLTSDELMQASGGAGSDQPPAGLTQLQGLIKDVAANPGQYENHGQMFGGPLVGFVRQTAPDAKK
jgi:hypothetical protein